MSWGIAFFPDPRTWRIGKWEPTYTDGSPVGVMWCFGPIALLFDDEPSE
ncbi:hypothetical protein RISW2_21855 [Roseivivax isoporae LMG 25204]|uniref:Uncharacterized protein n=1 Tax=Roseivivax isoporae LMG 25204 TaxID=1449351 RepID=X7F3H8_9RHOB|nr:hypothetical protein RISW2_21855 [Roseivivax isoporae LMG 25204]